MESIKREAMDMIQRMPDEATWDDIMYEIYVRKKIERGVEAADEGRVVPHEEVRNLQSSIALAPGRPWSRSLRTSPKRGI